MTENDRFFTVLVVAAGLGSTVLTALLAFTLFSF